jgi:uncharacterized protein YqeY
MRAAMQARDELTKNVLGLALGEIQTAEARANRSLTDDEVVAILRRLVKANEETLAHATGDAARSELTREVEVLSSLLPKSLSAEAIGAALAPVAEAVRAATNEGQAMGIAMKHLKASGAPVEAPAVQQAVRTLRR